MIEIIGFGAATLTTIGWLPQIVRIWQTRETKDLSLWANLMILVGLALWLAYGILTGIWPIIIANTIACFLVGSIVAAKLIYK